MLQQKATDEKEQLVHQVLLAVQALLSQEHTNAVAPHSSSPLSSLDLAAHLSLEHDKVVGALNSLSSKDQVTLSPPIDRVSWFLTDEGARYADVGSPEWRLFQHVIASPKRMTLSDIQTECPPEIADVGWKTALKHKWLLLEKDTKIVLPTVDSVQDKCKDWLSAVKLAAQEGKTEAELVSTYLQKDGGSKILQDLKKRKLVDVRKTKYYTVEKGPSFSLEIKKLATDLTQEMILRDTWQHLEFKPYNFFAAGVKPSRGSVHPLIRVLKKFKKILFSMGFEEMSTENWVESSFWNFDALFQPQQHPARDVQDTFFLKEPASGNGSMLPQAYVQRVKDMHERGGNGSIGWRYEWSRDEAEKNILRTHTTACSARILYKLAQEYRETGRVIPRRYFSIDRVFRNETLDATHLAEFHQVEGLVCDVNLSLADLMGTLSTFYKKIGITELRFKPAFNPYTEPSMEIFGFHEDLGRWIEVGNSGIFRPEMLEPMGFPSNVSVIAWGLSLERPTMIQYNVRNIRELFGHKAVLGMA